MTTSAARSGPGGTPTPGRTLPRDERSLPARPALRPGVHRLWRGPHVLQIGRDPRRALVLADVDDDVWDVLERLDGRHTLDTLLAFTRLPDVAVLTMLHQLDTVGLIDDAATSSRTTAALTVTRRDQLAPEQHALVLHQSAPGEGARTFRSRTRAVVGVEGLGRVGAALTLLLDAAGVGQLLLHDDHAVAAADVSPGGHRLVDVSRGRAAALRDRVVAPLRRPTASRRRRHTPQGDPAPELVVLTDALTLGERMQRSDELSRADVPHLLVEVAEGVGRLGPLVLPGRSACLHCLDHARADRDPQWPMLLAQLVDATVEVPGSVLAAQLAALAAAEVCSWLDARTAQTVGAQLVVQPPTYRAERRALTRHPGCGCGWGGTIAS